jgi:hypothetical protein
MRTHGRRCTAGRLQAKRPKLRVVLDILRTQFPHWGCDHLWAHRGERDLLRDATPVPDSAAARDNSRRCHALLAEPQVEDDENDPDWLADEAVVAWLKVPCTLAVVPDAVLLKLNDADPAPPETALSSSALSSIMISISHALSQ